MGVVDLRELVLAPTTPCRWAKLMVAPVVAAEADDVHDDLAELFAKYHYRMIPVVDREGLPAGRDPLQRHHEGPGRAGGLAISGCPQNLHPSNRAECKRHATHQNYPHRDRCLVSPADLSAGDAPDYLDEIYHGSPGQGRARYGCAGGNGPKRGSGGRGTTRPCSADGDLNGLA